MSSLDLHFSAPKAPASPRDTDFYLESIFFKVEGRIFLVPRQHFETNAIFSTTFMLPPGGRLVEGLSEEHPFELKGVSRKDFHALMSIFYPRKIPTDYSEITVEEWESILSLSTMWEFQSIRDMAIQRLSAPGVLEAAAKILLGEKFSIYEWFTIGCEELIMRSRGPRAAEIDQLGSELAVRIQDLREERIRSQARQYSFSAKDRVRREFQDIIGSVGNT